MAVRRRMWGALWLGVFSALVPSGTSSAADASPWAVGRLPSVSFVVTCGFSHRAADDPIIHPGRSGHSHGHDFFGNTTTDALSDAASLASGSSTCNEEGDRAAYWLPTLLGPWWAPRLRAYYSAGSVAPSSIVPYPAGLQLIAERRGRRNASVDDALSFSCGRRADESGWSQSPPRCSGPTTVRLTFPQCWDGKRLQAPGNAVGPVDGRCPAPFPVALPLLRLVVSTAAPVDPAKFMTSAGAAISMHADFFNAWDPAALRGLVDVCTRGERTTNRDVKKCRTAGTGPRAVGGPDKAETNF